MRFELDVRSEGADGEGSPVAILTVCSGHKDDDDEAEVPLQRDISKTSVRIKTLSDRVAFIPAPTVAKLTQTHPGILRRCSHKQLTVRKRITRHEERS